ncbi:MAG: L,D-transpeptidase family protein [Alphaproteobacteria bacterium]|nr:L,D-transpeptidase family protein [Alphaproteobacteria bacterium]
MVDISAYKYVMNIIVQTTSFDATSGLLIAGGKSYPCVLGRGGVTLEKTEGDGATPVGTFAIRHVYYRADKGDVPATGVASTPVTQDMGWCDDPSHADYNQLVTLPHAGCRDEKMYRTQDDVYDIIAVLSYNDDPVVPGRGSAIFMHVARPELTPTAGCVALKKEDLLAVLEECDADSYISILPPPDAA